MKRYINIVNERFGRLVALRMVGKKFYKHGKYRQGFEIWECLCDCGKKTNVIKTSLRNGVTKSCGCLKNEGGKNFWKHGLGHTKFNNTYHSIFQRCNNPNAISFPYYGGRGIKNLWNSFEEFRDDMYDSYKLHCEKFGEKHTTIDRIDNNGNYSKENCRWANLFEQAENKTNNVNISYFGKIKCLREWSRIIGKDYMRLYHRVVTHKWSIQKAFETPM